jgi:hypothetical protein
MFDACLPPFERAAFHVADLAVAAKTDFDEATRRK